MARTEIQPKHHRAFCTRRLVFVPIAVLLVWLSPCNLTANAVDMETVQRELATVFQTTAPVIANNHADSKIISRIQPLMVRQAGYLCSLLQPAPGGEGALSITESKSNEHGIRPNARALNGLAFMARAFPDEALPTTLTRQMCRDRALGMLQFVLTTHGAGGTTCTDGKHWKDQWQSALWAGSAGLGAWQLWDDLSPEMRWLAARMIADEANRFVGVTPPAKVEDDTKAEENAWNSIVISLAACMFPHHPQHETWKRTAQTWAASSFVRAADLGSSTTIDGATLASRGIGPTLHDDYTMENHHRVHPDYMNTINIVLEQWVPYTWAGLPQPEALRFNTREVYGTLRALTFPDLGYIYINGQDWQLHRNPQWLPTHALQAILFDDAAAAMLMQGALEVNEAMMARTADGGVFLPEEFQFPSAQADTLEMYMHVYLAAAAFGDGPPPMEEQSYWDSLAGIHLYQAGKFVVVRTGKSVSTFSWADQPMGMVLPLQKDLLLAPNERSLIGAVSVHGVKREQPKVISAKPATLNGHFVIAGELSRAEGAMKQLYAFVALADGRTVYVDNLRIMKTVMEPQINLGTLSVLNDKNWIYHDGTRYLYFDGGKRTFDANDEKEPEPAELKSSWYNLDDKLGIVVAATGDRQLYDDNKKIVNGRLEQLFHLNSLIGDASEVEASETPLTSTALVFYPNQSHQQTAAEAARVHIEWTGDDTCIIKLEDGLRIAFNLALSTISITR